MRDVRLIFFQAGHFGLHEFIVSGELLPATTARLGYENQNN